MLLGIMFFLMIASASNESAIMDELAHIPAGYSYVALMDMRLNPEHPPLIKDLAGIPLLFLDLNFPTDVKAWKDDLNGQWDMGRIFLYEAGNDADQILFWARLPMMLLAILFGWILYAWTQRRFGRTTALMTLFLFAFSPTFIAHSRYVTTDLAASFGFLIGLLTFIDFLEQPTRKHAVIAGIALGIALLLKFSTVLLLPVYGIALLAWIIAHYTPVPDKNILYSLMRFSIPLFGKIILMGIVAATTISLVYQWHVWQYPSERQLADATTLLESFGIRPLANFDLWLIKHDFTRAFGQYILGVLMVVQRAAGGNTTYFVGEVTNGGWWYYFPLLYMLKETAALHILTIVAIIVAGLSALRHMGAGIEWIRAHIAETAMLIFIIVYWIYSIRSTLNIGVRHVLPTFPFVYILVSHQITRWLQSIPPTPGTVSAKFFHVRWRSVFIAFCLSWTAFSVIFAFPYYLSYFNEFAGGSDTAYRIVADSNYDWGQDLKRLRDYAEENNISHIAVDYFGGGSPLYYLGEKFEPWWSSRGAPEGYFAISATFRQGAFGTWVNEQRRPEDQYLWLRDKEPIARAGQSIFIYKF